MVYSMDIVKEWFILKFTLEFRITKSATIFAPTCYTHTHTHAHTHTHTHFSLLILPRSLYIYIYFLRERKKEKIVVR